MIKAIIVDDEINAIKNLKWEIENFCNDITVCDTFTNPVDAISAINYLQPDCVFLDIEMPEMDGFQLLNNLNFRNFDLIITTAYENHAIQAFKEHAIDYLLKPIDSEDLIVTVQRIRDNKNRNALGDEIKSLIASYAPSKQPGRLALSLIGKTIYVAMEDIIYCKANGNYSEIYFKEAKKEMVSKKLKELESVVNQSFFRVHNSYLVNVHYIKEFVKTDGPYLLLKDGTNIPVSRSKKASLLAFLGNPI
ncbi:LytR/AlgR family response regulator transcription factor [Marinirhabdus gelatinilytica]|uniref:LytTR family two component transcriptional regulator n=1 Tax=Marinirhabdus gelatinilytica TaxID=1703343 RepID=A0A370QF20_9FLAO|nr:LytTR family DNA-binding domain-containing protein [Marinirhabdus gelatinilytica]RDK86963.1 LytTR family two component transcriptional regulator [Marinirhabdus gelatinilytica]